MIVLSGALSRFNDDDKRKSIASSKNIDNILSIMTGGESIAAFVYILGSLRTLENNMLKSALLGNEVGQAPEPIPSADGSYFAQGKKVVGRSSVSIASPVLSPGQRAFFSIPNLNNNVTDPTAIVSSSTHVKSKWTNRALLSGDQDMMSDLFDCPRALQAAAVKLSRHLRHRQFPRFQPAGVRKWRRWRVIRRRLRRKAAPPSDGQQSRCRRRCLVRPPRALLPSSSSSRPRSLTRSRIVPEDPELSSAVSGSRKAAFGNAF